MNILHMKYAVEVANTRSISKAAENLYTSQPNLSRAIKALESDLKIKIFKRSSKGLEITIDGEEFLLYAKNALTQIKKIESIYENRNEKQLRLSVCVPRASYFSYAFSEFSKSLENSASAEIVYKETNSMRSILNVVKEEYDLGIVRYQSAFEKYFNTLFEEKKLNYEMLNEFSYVMAMSKDNPLAKKDVIVAEDLAGCIEITHGDPYVPSLPLIDVKRAELSEFSKKRIMVFERGVQFTLLEQVPNTYMWVSPIPQDLKDKYNLVERKCTFNTKTYKDVLIYRKKYHLTKLDNEFINKILEAKNKYFNKI
ncbi:MAG: LysR family transcriptional regulator [Clostridiales bacterium]|nr:LysR family transcriptional regulator [Clostridiales bacterium]